MGNQSQDSGEDADQEFCMLPGEAAPTLKKQFTHEAKSYFRVRGSWADGPRVCPSILIIKYVSDPLCYVAFCTLLFGPIFG
mmetsp:Transcript_66352/g.131543  ORF Transcript_66352/g.131543 Transcript_66352/m.131543 type:complete len:81 (-) Transcript_66352:41-283(-)